MSLVASPPNSGTLRRNSLWLLLARVTAQGLAVVFVAIAARRLGVTSFGQFTVFAALIMIGNTLTNFGTDTLLVRDVARSRRIAPLAAHALGLQLALSGACCLVVYLLRPDPALILYSLILFPLAVYSVNTALLRAFERMDLFWSLSLVNGLAQIPAVYLATDLWSLCLYLLVGQIFVCLISILVCASWLSGYRLFPIGDVRPVLASAWPFAALTIVLVISLRLGILTVSAVLGDRATGLYSAASRVVEGLRLGHYAILGALLPVMARSATHAESSWRKGLALLVSLSVGFAITMTLLAPLVIRIVYGDSYLTAAALLPVLGWSLVPYTIHSFLAYAMIARSQERTLLVAAICSLGITAGVYITLVLRSGLPGAAWGALIADSLQAAVFLLFARRSGVLGGR